jgi:hypothetical protein
VPYILAAALAAVACAGKSETRSSEDDDEAGGSAGSGAGGTSQGGSGGTAGSVTIGGTGGTAGSITIGGTGGTAGTIILGGSAGAIVIGGAGGTAGSAGSTGELPHPFLACLMPAEVGSCNAAFERFFFNSVTLACEPFTWGGCDGNQNRFESLEECETACVAELPKDCTPESRGPGCPCGPDIGDCSRTSCSSAPYELIRVCVPWDTMLCSRGGAKGGCWCNPATGDEGCGV